VTELRGAVATPGVVFASVGRLIVPTGSTAKTKLNWADVLYVLANVLVVVAVVLIGWALHLRGMLVLGVAMANIAGERIAKFCRVRNPGNYARMKLAGYGMLIAFVIINLLAMAERADQLAGR